MSGKKALISHEREEPANPPVQASSRNAAAVAGTDKAVDWGSLALQAYVGHKFPTAEIEPGLKEGAFYDPTNFTFPAGCHICEVEIDPQTGRVEVVAYASANDVGHVVNPLIVAGQLEGGAVQGIGQALCEHLVYDAQSAQLVTGSFMDYAMPRADIVGPIATVLDQSTPCLLNPLGVKGVGELGTIGATPAVVNAIIDALSRAGHGETARQLQMPVTDAKVWRALQPATVA
jgi:carbon-monoxide dehydrogenase large subunit